MRTAELERGGVAHLASDADDALRAHPARRGREPGAQLPEELGRFLETVDDVERFEFRGFVDRVAEREELGEDDRADAAFHARAVIDVVVRAVTDGQLEDVREELPAREGYDELFEIADEAESP